MEQCKIMKRLHSNAWERIILNPARQRSSWTLVPRVTGQVKDYWKKVSGREIKVASMVRPPTTAPAMAVAAN